MNSMSIKDRVQTPDSAEHRHYAVALMDPAQEMVLDWQPFVNGHWKRIDGHMFFCSDDVSWPDPPQGKALAWLWVELGMHGLFMSRIPQEIVHGNPLIIWWRNKQVVRL